MHRAPRQSTRQRSPLALRRAAIAAAVVLACLTPLGAARADTVTMHSGTIYYGEVIEETPTHISIKTKVSNIVTTLKLARADIASIEKTDNPVKPGYLDDTAPSRDDDDDASPTTAASGSGAGSYMLIPITGEIGRESMGEGVKNALKAAKSAKVRHIVFDINTPGGRVDDANEMVAAIIDYRNAAAAWDTPPRFYAYVRNAISAGIWVMFSCDVVCWSDQAIAGGAVAFKRDQTTGDASVDAKMNSILAAQLMTAAETLGHPPELVRAMMIMEAELHAWEDGGQTRLSNDKPRNQPGARELDGPREVLTLTTSQALDLGFGRLVAGGPEQIGPALGIAGWKQAGKGGEAAMKAAARAEENRLKRAERDSERAKEVYEKATALNATLSQAIDRAQAADPRAASYTTRGGVFTDESRAEWSRRSATAIKMWTEILDRIREMDKLDREFKKLTGDSIFNRIQGRMVANEVDAIITRLRSEANRDRP